MNTELVVSKPNGDVTPPLSLRDAADVVSDQSRRKGNASDGWRLKIRGDEFGQIFHDHAKLMERWKVLAAANNDKGDVIVVDIMEHPYSIVSRWVESLPAIKDTSGNDDIDLIYTWWHATFGGSRNAGICVYKFTSGRLSQHCRWMDNNNIPGDGANASDEFLNTMDAMKDAAYEAVALGKRWQTTNGDDGLPLGRMIIASMIWDPFQGWHYYSGGYHYHNHMEGRWWLINGYAARC